MARELAIRVSSEIGAWVRQQPGSATKTVLALVRDLGKRRERISVADPGPGDDRLKVRLEPHVIRSIRTTTHSREAMAAVRKLLAWGVSCRARPASPSGTPRLPGPAPQVGAAQPKAQHGAPERRALLSRESWAGIKLSPFLVPASPSPELLKAWRRTRAELLNGSSNLVEKGGGNHA